MAPTGEAAALRRLPSVESLLVRLGDLPRPLALASAREELDARRVEIRSGGLAAPGDDEILAAIRRRAERAAAPNLRRVINATGVILHTNLGRAPLAEPALDELTAAASGYSNLEFDLASGERGSRHDHIEALVRELSGAEAAIAVNNNAAAVLLALTATAAGREVVIGRGQLIEIGGSFRIPDILACSGARLVEVGTTNRTRVGDYAEAIGPDTAAIMRVHQSNFRSVGFVAEPALDELAALARERGVALIDDLGSGAIGAVEAGGEREPTLGASIVAGADLVCASADKLLGGPQAGLIAGSADAVARCRQHPMARAMRLDKLQIAALEATLRLHRDGREAEIPALAMLRAPQDGLRSRAELLASAAGPRARVEESVARPGGGTMPLAELPGQVCVVAPGETGVEALARNLREGPTPVIARIEAGELVLDPRTMSDSDVAEAGRVLAALADA
ncbi:L-seryl-tRNA(Sec) selenium transferase [Thermoleophilia bacterium SCSIO 60948]|nr:L-seryl-tRNA(Sec) selenium transferase [Thermoleophilia bacterium SCSIO 60948]